MADYFAIFTSQPSLSVCLHDITKLRARSSELVTRGHPTLQQVFAYNLCLKRYKHENGLITFISSRHIDPYMQDDLLRSSRYLDLRSDFELDLSRSHYIWFGSNTAMLKELTSCRSS